MLEALLPSFCNELQKIAASMPKKVEGLLTPEKKDWKSFEKNLRSPRFTAEVERSPLADDKLKAYTRANNDYRRSKATVAEVPSLTSSSTYKIKKLPNGRLGCSCRDWQYKRSWDGSDCVHIKKATLLEKRSNVATLVARGMGAGLLVDRAGRQAQKGREANQTVRAVRRTMGGAP